MPETIPSIKELRILCKKKNYQPHWRIRALWSISIYFSKLFLYLRLTPVQINWLMTIVQIAGIILFIKGGYFYNIAGVLLIHLGILLDVVEGEISRYKNKESARAGYLDLMSHIIIFPAVFIGLGIGAYSNNPAPFSDNVLLIAGFANAYFLMLINFVRLKKYEYYVKKGNFAALKNLKPGSSKAGVIKRELKYLLGIGYIFNFLLIFAILNILPYFLLLHLVISPIIFFRRFYLALESMEK